MRTLDCMPWKTVFRLYISAPNTSPIACSPKQTPRIGFVGAYRRMTALRSPASSGNTGTRRQNYLVETLHVVNIELVVSPNSNFHIFPALFFEILRKVVCE